MGEIIIDGTGKEITEEHEEPADNGGENQPENSSELPAISSDIQYIPYPEPAIRLPDEPLPPPPPGKDPPPLPGPKPSWGSLKSEDLHKVPPKQRN